MIFGETRVEQHAAHELDVAVGARMARSRDRQALALERRSCRRARDRLERLHRRSRKHDGFWVAQRQRGVTIRRASTIAAPACRDSTKPPLSAVASSTEESTESVPGMPSRICLALRTPYSGGMIQRHSYALTATWTGNRGSGTSGTRDYDRSVTLRVDGKPDLLGSADKPFFGDPERWNPERPAHRGARAVPPAVVPARLRAARRRGHRVHRQRDGRDRAVGRRRPLHRRHAAPERHGSRRGDARGGCRSACGCARVVLHRQLRQLSRRLRAHRRGRRIGHTHPADPGCAGGCGRSAPLVRQNALELLHGSLSRQLVVRSGQLLA